MCTNHPKRISFAKKLKQAFFDSPKDGEKKMVLK